MGGVFIHEKFHGDRNIKRFAGWWGYDKNTRFKMEKGFKPIPTAEGWQLSTPSVLLYASHKAALQIFEKAGWENLQAKQKLLNNYLWFVLDELNRSSDKEVIEFITPKNKSEISCQVSMLMLKRGREIFKELSKQGVMVDWRNPMLYELHLCHCIIHLKKCGNLEISLDRFYSNISQTYLRFMTRQQLVEQIFKTILSLRRS